MIISIHAIPGAGKTLHMVHLLEQMRESTTTEYYLIGNIEGYSFDETIAPATSPNAKEEITNYIVETDWESKVSDIRSDSDKKVVLVFDECQSFVRKGSLPRHQREKLLLFFEYHRHYGLDIYLITQDWKKLDLEIQTLVSEIHQVSQATLKNAARVKIINPLDFPETKDTLTYGPIDKYFSLYKSSFNDHGNQKPQSIFKKYIKYISALFLVFIIFFIYLIYTVSGLTSSSKPAPDSAPVNNTKPIKQSVNNTVVQQSSSFKKPNNIDLAIARLRETWQHPLAPEMFDAVNCFKSSPYSYTCPNVEESPIFSKLFTSYVCNYGVCNYTYFDSLKFVADGHDDHCCLPDGLSLADRSTTSLLSPSNDDLTDTTTNDLFK